MANLFFYKKKYLKKHNVNQSTRFIKEQFGFIGCY